ncbi:hypothetical protein D3C86_1555010 [compost metagenome]
MGGILLTIDETFHHQGRAICKGGKNCFEQITTQHTIGSAQPANGGGRRAGLLIETGKVLLQSRDHLPPRGSIQAGEPLAIQHRHGAAIRKHDFLSAG